MLKAIGVSSNGSGAALDFRASRSMMLSAITPSRMFVASLVLCCDQRGFNLNTHLYKTSHMPLLPNRFFLFAWHSNDLLTKKFNCQTAERMNGQFLAATFMPPLPPT